jgi:hypothetical protein
MARPGVVQVGAWKWPAKDVEGLAVVKWKSSGKVDQKESDGKDDARTTWKGRKTGDVSITITWKETDAADAAATAMLTALSPRGPNSGLPFELVAADQGIHNAHSIIVTDLAGPNRTPGSGQATADITASTWSKPSAPAGGKGKTPDAAVEWKNSPMKGQSGFDNNASTTKVGSNGNTVGGFTSDDAPKAKP